MKRIKRNIYNALFQEKWTGVKGRYSRLLTSDLVKKLLDEDIDEYRCLKVLKNCSPTKMLESSVGRDDNITTVKDMIMIQNLFAIHGLAPRIYDYWVIDDERQKFIALEMDYVDKTRATNIQMEKTKKKLLDICITYRITPYFNDLDTKYNYIGDQYVDFHGWNFNDFEAYKESLFKRIADVTHWGRGERMAYQQTEDFEGKRKTDKRFHEIGKIDFKDKSVLDIGCNLGMFCHLASDSGAKKIVGIDKEDLINVALEYANIKGYWNIKFEWADLTISNFSFPYESKDIIFYLSMNQYLGIPGWVINCLKKGGLLYFESNPPVSESEYMPILNKYFEVEDLGFTDDRNKRKLLKCRKK